MNDKITTIVLIFLFILYLTTMTINAQTISTLSTGTLTATPKAAIIKVEITAADKNRAKLQNQFKIFLNSFKTNLFNNSKLTKSNLKLSNPKHSYYTKKTGYNNARVYQTQVNLKLILSENNPEIITKTITEIINIIEDNNPNYQTTNYNSLTKLNLNYKQAYYYFNNISSLQQNLLKDALKNNQNKAQTLAKILTSTLPTLTKIEEIKSANLANYQQKINLKQPQIPNEVDLKTKLRISYELNK